jgi:protein-disulfide isomerase
LDGRSARNSNERPALKVSASPIPLDGAARKGDSSAKLVLIEFADFQCPYCGKFAHDALRDIERDFVATGKLQLVFRHLPLGIHPFARSAAAAAICASSEGRFWQMHDRLFENPSRLDDKTIRSGAEAIGLDTSTFESCLVAESTRRQLEADAALAESLGVKGTPAFLVAKTRPDGTAIGIEWIGGAVPYKRFREVLDKAQASLN